MRGLSRPSLRDRSPVSLTGRYTGEVWVKNRLSPGLLSTLSGRSLYRTLRPLDQFALRSLGVSLEISLVQRHRIIDQLLTEQLEKSPDLQILEFAAGTSARAWRILKAFPAPSLSYLESDLPDVVNYKQRLLPGLGLDRDKRHLLVPCNILRTSGVGSPEALLEGLDERRPVLVITEGLLNYFPLKTVQSFIARLRDALQPFPEATYLTEIWPRLPAYPAMKARSGMIRLIESVTRQRVPLHYDNDVDIAAGFRQAGYGQVRVIDPDGFDFRNEVPVMASPALFRVVKAVV